nr:GDSL esterase/lipase LIP-4-like [Ipomoea batatas]
MVISFWLYLSYIGHYQNHHYPAYLLFDDDDFGNALYMIDICQNDITNTFTNSFKFHVLQQIPTFNSEIKNVIHPLNEVAKKFNSQLRNLCEDLRTEVKNATKVYVDMYTIKYDIISNFALYDFENLLMACCGVGHPTKSIPTYGVGRVDLQCVLKTLDISVEM